MTTFTKLRNGTWGLCGAASELNPGSAATVCKRDGSRKTLTVDRVLWTDGKVALVSIAAERTTANASPVRRRSTGLRRHECEDCGQMVVGGSTCWETGMKHYGI